MLEIVVCAVIGVMEATRERERDERSTFCRKSGIRSSGACESSQYGAPTPLSYYSLVEIQPFCSPSKELIDEPEVKSCVSREP